MLKQWMQLLDEVIDISFYSGSSGELLYCWHDTSLFFRGVALYFTCIPQAGLVDSGMPIMMTLQSGIVFTPHWLRCNLMML